MHENVCMHVCNTQPRFAKKERELKEEEKSIDARKNTNADLHKSGGK